MRVSGPCAGVLFACLMQAGAAHTQEFAPAWADSVLARISGSPINDYETTLPLARRLYAHYADRRDTCHMADACVAMGSCYDALGTLDSALIVLLRALSWSEKSCPPDLYDRAALNLSAVYLSLEEFQRCDSICTLALDAGGRSGPHTFDLVYNRAVARASLGDHAGAEAEFMQLLAWAGQRGDTVSQIDALCNVGALRGMQHDDAGAERHLREALRLCQRMGCSFSARILQNLAVAAASRGDHRARLALLDSARVQARAEGDLELQVVIVRDQAKAAHELGEHELAWAFMEEHRALSDSLLDVEKVKAVSDVQEKYQTEKKAKEILSLRAANLEVELDRARVKRIRNLLYLGLAFAITFSGVFFFQRNRIAREKERSEELLLNILPEEVAEELKAKGEADAVQFDQVTVLFTDFKGFTALSEIVTPAQLVKDLNECFSAFDRITETYGIEKIKTIGDAYMAAGGLPTPNNTHPTDVINAALEMRDFIAEGKARKVAAGLPYFEVRIGIHTGPVVAGIVGVKKFQYDIWGDTVNTASRMESSGEVGQVNISEATYALVKDASTPLGTPAFTFTSRGKVQAKGKGEMEMYFVQCPATISTRRSDGPVLAGRSVPPS